MKTIFRIIKIGLILIVAYVAVGPYITKSSIKTGIIKDDVVKLSENIDFAVLKYNLKAQFNAKMLENVPPESKNNPLTALATSFATTVTDGLVETLTTPRSLSILMTGNNPTLPPWGGKKRLLDDEHLFKNARTSYDSLSSFSIWVPNDEGNEVRFVLNREGIKWKLVNIFIHTDKNK